MWQSEPCIPKSRDAFRAWHAESPTHSREVRTPTITQFTAVYTADSPISGRNGSIDIKSNVGPGRPDRG